jgi:hypothetical protein
MTLGHKIAVLLGFMGLVTLCVVFWFINRTFYHMTEFKASLDHDKETFEASFDRSVAKLEDQAKSLRQDVRDHFNKVEAEFARGEKESEAFYENFSRKQNQFFDEMGNFLASQKKGP